MTVSVFLYTLITTATTRLLGNASCVSQTWISSANRLASWLFNGNYVDQLNNYNATPTDPMSFTNHGYVNQAIQFVANGNRTLNVPPMSLSYISFTIDVWLYITGLWNVQNHGIFGYCAQQLSYRCLHLTLRQSNGSYFLYMGFFNAGCLGGTVLTLNTWIHAAFVFDFTTLTQKIYLNGVLDAVCTQLSSITVETNDVTIGFVLAANNPLMTYFQGNIDQMTVSTRAKSECEILEIATLVAHFTFNMGLFLNDSGPNSLQATTQFTSSISIGRYSQAITFDAPSASYYQISSLTSLATLNKPFSFSLWLRPSSLDGVVVYGSRDSTGTGPCNAFLGFSNLGVLHAQIYDGDFRISIADGNSSVSTSVWSHIVQTWSPINGLRLYVNNALVGSIPALIYDMQTTSLYLTLGNGLAGLESCPFGSITRFPYNGDMDDFRVYSRELSANDVFILYTN